MKLLTNNAINKKQLEDFRDLKIKKIELKNLNPDIIHNLLKNPISICNIHLISLLKKYKEQQITKNTLLNWVNTIWFSDFYDYCDEHNDSIASIMHKLEELDENHNQISKETINEYIFALKNNTEIID